MYKLAAVLAFVAFPAAGQHEHPPSPRFDVVQLQAEASRDVDNDRLVAVLAAEAQGANPAELSEAVNRTMAAALKAAAEVPTVRARSGNYQTLPRYGRERRQEGWLVSQELRLESADFAAAARLIGRLQQALVVRGMAVQLSPEGRRAAEDALIGEAIAAFQARAERVRQAMRASGYRVLELHIATAGGPVRPLAMAARAEAAAAPVAIEPGMSQLTVTASGSIQLERK